MRKPCVLLLLFGVALGCVGQTGPFGFQKGMTRSEIVALVGPKAVDPRVKGEAMRLNKAPEPNAAFQEYLLAISPTDGLVRVVALGKLISTGDDGRELRAAYADLVSDLTEKFGPPATNTDECDRGGALCRPDFWMAALFGKQRRLETTWFQEVPTQAMRQAGVHMITVTAQPASISSGYITCDFQLEGFDKYSGKKKPQAAPTPQPPTPAQPKPGSGN